MGSPARYTYGLTTAPKTAPLGGYPLRDPFQTSSNSGFGVSEYANDFMSGVTEYTVTGTSSTFAVENGVGGLAILTPGGTTTASSAYKTYECVQFVSGQQLWFVARFELSAVGVTSLTSYVGLQYGSAVTDGLWFSMASASSSLNLVSTVGSTATTLVSGVATLTAATMVEVGFWYDGADLLVYAGQAVVGRVTAPTIGASATNLTNKDLTPVFQITPTATQTLTADYVLAAMEVSR